MMQPDQYSRTALAAAFYRAQHHLHDEAKLLDDPYAHRLLTTAEMAAFAERRIREGLELGVAPGDSATVLARTLRAITPASSVLVRARYAEDRLAKAVERHVGQYVLVGAGLDTFAFRRGDLRDCLQIFELDHLQSQVVKRERLAAADLAEPPNLHFGPVDFEREGVAEALGRLPFRPDQPAVFAWLGVNMYLTRTAIEVTWRDLRNVAAPGSELVFDFIHRESLSATAAAGARRLRDRARAIGEPIITALDPATLAADLETTGWTLLEQLERRSTAATSRRAPTATAPGRWHILPAPRSDEGGGRHVDIQHCRAVADPAMSLERCARCTDLALRWAIENPADQTRAIHIVRDNLADGTLVEIPAPPDGGLPAASFASLPDHGPWPDTVQNCFRCAVCGRRFHLVVDTYHGGGMWEPV